jgi:hypothetical protein
MEVNVSSVASIGSSVVPPQAHPTPAQAQVKSAPDGDTPAQEAAETNAAKRAEKQNGGFAPKSGVDKIA